MTTIDNTNSDSFKELKDVLTSIIGSKNKEDVAKTRLFVEVKLLDPKWGAEVLFPLTKTPFFQENDFSEIFYNVPYKLMDVIAENYDVYIPLSVNKYTRCLISVITNIIESDNSSLNLVISMVDYLNKLDLEDVAQELTLKLRFHIINEIFLSGIRRLKETDFVCSEFLKLIVVSYLRLFLRISQQLTDPLFFLKRIFVFVRDFMPPEFTAEDEEELTMIRKLLLNYLFKVTDILITCKNSSALLNDKTSFKHLGSELYQLALSYDVDFDKELSSINSNTIEFKEHFLENCKDKKDDEIHDYLYNLAITQDAEKEKSDLLLDYKTLIYLYLTNHLVENKDSIDVPAETLLVTLFKINALHMANEYNDPFILNGVIESKIQSLNVNSIDLPEKIVTQVLQQLCFQGESSFPTIKKILSLMDYNYQMRYILDTLSDCFLAEVRANTWKYLLPEFIKTDDKVTWISLCNIADIEVLNYTDDQDEDNVDESENLKSKQVVESLMAFLGKYKSLSEFVKNLQELINMYESLVAEAEDE